jgi:hypothetical protein
MSKSLKAIPKFSSESRSEPTGNRARTPEYDEFCHPLQHYAATWYSFMLPVITGESCHGSPTH